MDVDAMGLGQFHGQLIERDLALLGDAGLDPAGHARQLAVPTAVALRPRIQRSGFPPQLDQIVHKSRRHPEMPGCFSMPVTLIDKRGDTLAQLYWMWLAQLRPPYLPQQQGITSSSDRES